MKSFIYLFIFQFLAYNLAGQVLATEDFSGSTTGLLPTASSASPWRYEAAAHTCTNSPSPFERWEIASTNWGGNSASGFSGKFAVCGGEVSCVHDAYLVVCRFIVPTGVTAVNVTYKHYYNNYIGDAGYVYIYNRTTGAFLNTGTAYKTYTSDQGSFSSPVKDQIKLTGLTPGSTYEVRFRYTANFDWYWLIDDVKAEVDVPAITTGLNTGCKFKFYDNGGELGNYTNSQTLTYTICPTDPTTQRTQVTFNSLALEATHDSLNVYMGTTASESKRLDNAGLSDVYVPPIYSMPISYVCPTTESSGCLTFKFKSDGSTNDAGWNADVTCVSKTVPACNPNATYASNSCAAAPLISDLTTAFCGTTWSLASPANYTVPGSTSKYYDATDIPATWGGAECGGPQNTAFIKFVPSASTVVFNYWVENEPLATGACSGGGVQLGVYSAPNGCASTWTQVGCVDPTGQTAEKAWTISGLTPGRTYYLYIDGYGGSTCAYKLKAISGVATCSIVLGATREVCNGDGTYNIEIDYTGGGAGTYVVKDLSDATIGNKGANPSTTASGIIKMGPYANGSTYNISIAGGSGLTELCDLKKTGTTTACAGPCANAREPLASVATVACGGTTSLSLKAVQTQYSISRSACTPTDYPMAAGTSVSLSDDAVSANLNIGFTFNFFGTAYTQFRIHSNGLVSFGSQTYTGYDPQTIPTTAIDKFIAGIYRDLDPGSGGTIKYKMAGVAPNRTLTVEFKGVPLYNGITSTTTFQIILYETSNQIRILTIAHPNQTDSWGYNKATQGIQGNGYTFVPPGRNWAAWGGITSVNNDCVTMSPSSGGCTFLRWEDALGNQLSTSATYSATPTYTSNYYAVSDCGSGNICKKATPISVSNGPCTPCAGKFFSYSDDGKIQIAIPSCTESGWSHYYDPATPTKLLFSINKNGLAFSPSAITIEASTRYSAFDVNTPALTTWVMNRRWNVEVTADATDDFDDITHKFTRNGTDGTKNVKVRFYYKPTDKTNLLTSVTNFINNFASGPIYQERSVWFKNTNNMPLDLDAIVEARGIQNSVELTALDNQTTNNLINYVELSGIDGFSGGGFATGTNPDPCSGCSPLPITLTSFTAVNNGANNKILWETASEENTEWHVIEKSSDGIRFNDLGKVAAAGNSSSPKEYNMLDNTPFPMTYYRLRTVDLDGSTSYSAIVAVKRYASNFDLVEVFPNPTDNLINARLTSSGNEDVSFKVVDALGRVVYQADKKLTSGSNTISIETSNFERAVYYLHITNSERNITVPFSKK